MVAIFFPFYLFIYLVRRNNKTEMRGHKFSEGTGGLCEQKTCMLALM